MTIAAATTCVSASVNFVAVCASANTSGTIDSERERDRRDDERAPRAVGPVGEHDREDRADDRADERELREARAAGSSGRRPRSARRSPEAVAATATVATEAARPATTPVFHSVLGGCGLPASGRACVGERWSVRSGWSWLQSWEWLLGLRPAPCRPLTHSYERPVRRRTPVPKNFSELIAGLGSQLLSGPPLPAVEALRADAADVLRFLDRGEGASVVIEA